MSALRRPSPRAALAGLGAVSVLAIGGIVADRMHKDDRTSAADLAIARAQTEEQCTRHEAVNYVGQARKSFEQFMNITQPGNPNNRITADLMKEEYQRNLLLGVGFVPHVVNMGVRVPEAKTQNGGMLVIVPGGLGNEKLGNMVLLAAKTNGECGVMEMTPKGTLIEATKEYQHATRVRLTSSHAGTAEACNPAALHEVGARIQKLMAGSKI